MLSSMGKHIMISSLLNAEELKFKYLLWLFYESLMNEKESKRFIVKFGRLE